ncbi:MAG: hypothetical protein GXN96_01670 [Aquificae bacterium]|nr:hypothetical protein [Aquificota bacterium]
MKFLLLLLILSLFSCQDIPEKYRTPEGRKLLEKYRYQFVEGVVEVSRELLPEAAKKKYLVLTLRREDTRRPIALLRVENPEFPYRFRISGKHKLDPDSFIEGEMILTGRLTTDPSPGLKEGDIFGLVPVKAGQKDARLILSFVYEEEKNENDDNGNRFGTGKGSGGGGPQQELGGLRPEQEKSPR